MGRLNIVKMLMLLKLIYRLNAILINTFFCKQRNSKMREREINYKESAHMIMEADKSQDPQLRGKLRGGLPW